MPAPALTDELALEAAQLKAKHGSIQAAADAVGVRYRTLQSRLRVAAQRGFLGTRPVLPGFVIAQTSAEKDADGTVRREWVKQKPSAGEEFAVPEGHSVRGVSALLDAGGNVVAQWVKTKHDDQTENVVQAIRDVFQSYVGYAVLPTEPVQTNEDLLTVYNIADAHLGLYAWKAETGDDYDLAIGERILREKMAELVSMAPAASTAIVLNLGDFVHADNTDNKTARSGNALDVDTRYAKVLQTGVKLLIDCVELALQKHTRVIVRCLPGNHDPHTALALSVALHAFFSRDERVTVDMDPSRFFWFAFGKVFIAASHGDMVKPIDMPGVMASRKPREWGETEFRYAYLGHVHHRSVGGGEKHGVIWETFQTLAAKDAWHAASGYSSGRSMTCITHDKSYGEVSRNTVSIPRSMP